MQYYSIACTWTETGTIAVKAETLEEAIIEVESKNNVNPLPNGEYLDDSFEVDYETSELLDNARIEV